jgi:hypothetical protein
MMTRLGFNDAGAPPSLPSVKACRVVSVTAEADRTKTKVQLIAKRHTYIATLIFCMGDSKKESGRTCKGARP